MNFQRGVSLFLTTLGILVFTACQTQTGASAPTIVIAAPPHGSAFTEGQVVSVQSSAADSAGISRVELLVDGNVVKQDAPPELPAPVQFTLVQNWTATAGDHTLTVRASNPNGVTGQTAISISVSPAASSVPTLAAQAQASPTFEQASPTPPFIIVHVTATPPDTALPSATAPPDVSPTTGAATCAFNAGFVADVTVPDNSQFAAGQAFNKIWRVLNNGNCAWQAGTTLAFAGGSQMSASNAVAAPALNPGQTADIAISMRAPSAPGTYSGTWRMRAPDGNFFGTPLSVVIIVPAPTANAACNGTPNDFDFNASSTNINKGDTVTISWSKVNNATGAFLSGGEFNNNGVETPGNRSVRPPTTTTYILRADCAPSGQSRDKSITINVNDTANRGPLNGNFSISPEFGPNEFSYFATAGDIDAPCQGDDGCNIDRVVLYLYDPDGTQVQKRTEFNPSYCLFGGGDNGNPCTFWVYSEHDNRWPNGSPIIAGEYRMYAEAFSKDGRKKTIEDFIELNPQ
ncbi:MAG: hypothetical protein EYC68_11530 [Chloroflexota bacterium]|nr:MAG: hypothetical protein EYC68_11530 [Chloroflexota bacterium]